MKFRLLLVAFFVLVLNSATSYGQTYYVMSSADYTQDFANISGWTNSYASGIGAANWRVASSVATSTLNAVNVFTTTTAGGIQKGAADMIILATGTNSTGTDLLLDFTGRDAGVISLNWTKVVNTASATPRTSDLKIQYSIDNGLTFTDLTGYTFPRVTNNATAESGSLSSITLPSGLDNQSQVVIRFYAWNNGQTSGSGNRPKISIDNILVTSIIPCTPPSDPTGSITGTTPACNSTTISFSGSASAPVVNYWQTSPTGTSTALSDNAANPITVNTFGTTNYYVRAFNTSTSCWSTNSVGPFAVTVNAQTPVVSINLVNVNISENGFTSFIATPNSPVASYQWQVNTGSGFNNISNDSNYSGVATPTLAITNAPLLFNNYIYRCVVLSSFPCTGGAVSATGTLTVTPVYSAASDIVAVGSEPATISSTANGVTISNATPGVRVWQIRVRDGGGTTDADTYATILTGFNIAQSGGNAVGTWSDAIFSIGLFDDTGFIANGTVTASQIQFSGLNISVADGGFKNLYLHLSLKCPLGAGAVDGDDFGFSISAVNTTFSAAGSGKNPSFTAAASLNTSNVIAVVATRLLFTTQPTTTGLNNTMTTVVVKATDACGNVDVNFTGNVSLISSGTMTAVAPVAAVAGVATFSNIVHTATGNNLFLTASSTVTAAISTPLFDIVPVTVFNPGELLFVGYDGQVNGSGAEDEYLIATLVDIKPKTQFSIVNSRYEAGASANVRTNKWGGGGDFSEEVPYTTLISYNGTTDIPAGSVLAFRTNGTANWFGSVDVITGTITTNRTSEFLGSLVYGTTFNPNISITGTDADQIYLIQGSFVSDGTIDVGQANYLLSGTLLHGLTNRVAWVPLTSACSGATTGGSTRQSRLPVALTCFNVENSASGNISGFYENDKEHGTATIRQIINAVGNVASNWTLGSGRYTKDPASLLTTRAARTFVVGPSNPAGSWVGDVSGDETNWFNCGNWEGLKVPDSTTDVVLNASSLSDAVIDFNAAYSDDFLNIASCNNLNITTSKVQVEASTSNVLEVYGNLAISASGTLDMDDGTAAADGIIKLKGNWTNSVGDTAFSEGNGTVEFVGTTPQLISSVATEGTEIFYNVVLDNNFDTAVSNDLIASGDLTIKTGRTVNIDSNGYIKAYKALNHSGDLTIQDNGQFIQVDESDANIGTYTGTKFQVKRIATVNKNDYVYWSSPTDAFNMSSILSNGARYAWNTTLVNLNGTQGNWAAASGTMTKGKGYAIGVPSTTPVRPALPQDLTTTFTGKPNNGPFDFTIYRGNYSGADYDAGGPSTNADTTKYDDNWNLVGNPYPSAISAEKFLIENGTRIGSSDPLIAGAVWIWKHGQSPTSTTSPFYTNFTYNYYSSDYIKYNLMGATDTNFAGLIASGQGFMVNMKEGTGSFVSAGTTTNLDVYSSFVTFNNSMRSVSTTFAPYNNTDFYRTNSDNSGIEEKHRIWLDIINNTSGQIDTTLLGYATNATIDEDNLYDAIFVPRGEVNLYSLISSNPFIIQGRPLPFDINDRVPMGVNIVTAGSHTIAIKNVDGMFMDDVTIYLEDTQLNIVHDLKQAPYIFDSSVGIFNNRFIVRYTNDALNNPDFETLNSSVVVATNHGELTIKSYIENMQDVTVYDILGRQLFEAKGISNTEFMASNISNSKQALIVKIRLENGIVVTRKILL